MSSTTPFRYAKTLYLIAGLLMFCVFATTVNSAATDTQLLQTRMKQLGEQGSLELQGELINSRNFLPEFYRQRDYQLVWTANMGNARMLTEALARYAYHLWFGKVNPERLDADWNFQRSFNGQDPLLVLQSVIDSADFDTQLDASISRLPVYPQIAQCVGEVRGDTRCRWLASDSCRANTQARHAGRTCAIDQATPAGHG